MKAIKKHIIDELHNIDEHVQHDQHIDIKTIHQIHELCEALYAIDKVCAIIFEHDGEHVSGMHEHKTEIAAIPHNPKNY